MLNFFNYSILLLLVLSSCIPEEDKVIAPAALDYKQVRFEQSIYTTSTYFDFGTGQTVLISDFSNWDIAFDCRENSHYVKFNSSQNVRGVKTDFRSLEASTFISDTFFLEEPTGVEDSFIGEWWLDSDTSNVYLIQGTSLGDIKIQLILNNKALNFNLIVENDGTEISGSIEKNPSYNYNYLNLQNPNNSFINEPLKDEWDIVLTQYTEYVPFQDTTLPFAQYLVRGVLSNRENNIEALRIDWDLEFDNITINTANELEFTSDRNIIGYDWKRFSFDENAYVVNPNLKFILKDNEGDIYKFRFIDFNNETGERGFPLLEFGKL